MRGIDHPSIVKLLSFFESDEHYFLVLELMEGGELFHQIVKLTYFSEDLSRHIIMQVAHGIRYLHEERGVVHRDIKPENLLFERIPKIPSNHPTRRPYDEEKEDEGQFRPGIGGGEIGTVKIADFGLSKIVWEETTKTPCGTVGYTAPEIVKDERYSKSVDMWALGCVLYTLLCGFPPFYDESINVLTEKVARGYYTFLSPWWDDISHSAKDLITHLLCVDPRQRYTIDEFLAHPWCQETVRQATTQPLNVVNPRLRDPTAPLDSPLLQSLRGHVVARSPGVAALKEAFDVTYAVHRMEEEGGQHRAKGAGGRGDLGNLNELEEDEEEDKVVVSKARDRQQQHQVPPGIPQTQPQSGHMGHTGRAGARDQGSIRRHGQSGKTGRSRVPGFELDLENATLLGRRHRKLAEPSPLSRAMQDPDGVGSRGLAPGSPMRGVEET